MRWTYLIWSAVAAMLAICAWAFRDLAKTLERVGAFDTGERDG